MSAKTLRRRKTDKQLAAVPTHALYAALTLLTVSLGVSSTPPAKDAGATENAGNKSNENRRTGTHVLQELLSARCKGCPKREPNPPAANPKPTQNMQSDQIKLQSNQHKLPSATARTKP